MSDPRNPAELVDAAWSEIGVQPPTRIRRWVLKNVEERERIECVTNWLRRELEGRERRETLKVERAAERPRPQPSTPDSDDERRERLQRERAEQSQLIAERIAALAEAVEEAVVKHEASLVLEWTPDLLKRPVRMPDGTPTTWGEATVEQHRIREAMFMENIAANVEGAARHRRAVKELTAAGASTLNELVAASEAA